jgi:hypothetical protein
MKQNNGGRECAGDVMNYLLQRHRIDGKAMKMYEVTVKKALGMAEDCRKVRDWEGVVIWTETAKAAATYLAELEKQERTQKSQD